MKAGVWWRRWRYLLLSFALCGGLLPTQAQNTAPSPPLPPVIVHVVQQNETPAQVAARYGIDEQQLLVLNNLFYPERVMAGQRLLVAQAQPYRVHIVQPGETLAIIAQRYGQDAAQLARQNNLLNPQGLYIGQRLHIFPAAAPPAPQHLVQAGENLAQIALRYQLPLVALAEHNQRHPDSPLMPGQWLALPAGSVPQQVGLLPPLQAITLTPMQPLAGQSLHLKLRLSTDGAVSGAFLGQALNFQQDGGEHHAFIPIPAESRPGLYPLHLQLSLDEGWQLRHTLRIRLRAPATAYVRQLSPLEAAPLTAPLTREEAQRLAELTHSSSPQRHFEGDFSLPGVGALGLPFHSHFLLGDEALAVPARGLQFRSGAGARVMAPAGGRVVLIEDLRVRGMTLVLDHGWGLYSVFAPLSDISLREGAQVSPHELLGFVSAEAGYLRWELWLHGVPVDPMQWVLTPFIPESPASPAEQP